MTRIAPKSFGLGELGDRTLRKVRRRVMPLIVLLYFVAYLDRNNVGFAKLTMSEDIGLNSRRLRAWRRHLLPRLRPPGGPEQRRHVPVRSPEVAGPHPHHVGHLCHRHVPGQRRKHDLHRPVPAGGCAGGRSSAIRSDLTLWFPAACASPCWAFILAQPVSNALGAPVSGLLLQMDGVLGLQGCSGST